MADWDSRILDHEAMATLADLKRLLKEMADLEGLQPEARDYLDRFEQIVRFVDTKLEEADPVLTPLVFLNNLNSQLAGLRNRIQAYVQSENLGVLTHPDTEHHADGAVQVASQIPLPETPKELEGIGETVRSIRISAGVLKSNMEKELLEVREEATKVRQELSKSLQEVEQKTDKEIQDRTQRVTERVEQVEKRITEAEENIATHVGQIRDAVASYEKQFREAEDRRQKRFEENTTSRTEKLDGLILEAKEKLVEEAEAYSKQANEVNTELKTLLAEAEETVGVIGSTGMAAAYKEASENEQKEATTWRWIAFGSLIALVLAAVFSHIFEGAHSWQNAVGRFVILGPLAALAAYAIAESSRHRKNQQSLRKRSLEFSSIGVYLREIDEQKRWAIKEKLAERFFAQPEPGSETRETSPSALIAVMKDMMDALQRAISKI